MAEMNELALIASFKEGIKMLEYNTEQAQISESAKHDLDFTRKIMCDFILAHKDDIITLLESSSPKSIHG